MCATWRLCPWRKEACSPLALLAGWNMDTWWVILNRVNEETPGWQSNEREEAWLLTPSQPGLPSCPDLRFLTCFLTSTVVSQGPIVIVSMLVSITRLWTPYEDLSPYFQVLTVAPELLWVLSQKRPLWMFIEWMNECSVTYTSLWRKSWQMRQKNCGGRATSHLKCMSRNFCLAACNRKPK